MLGPRVVGSLAVRSVAVGTKVRRSADVAVPLVLIVALLTLGLRLMAGWLQGAGVGVVGDEPAYLVQAQAFLHFTPHISGIYRSDLAHHYFSAFPPGTTISRAVFESYKGPRGVVSPFEPGIGLLLTPGQALGGQGGAFVGFFALEAAGLVLVHRRLAGLCHLGWRAQVFLGVAVAAPAVALAGTQLYPDLIAGIVLAAILVEAVRLEKEPGGGRWSVSIVAVGAAALPWLQIKDVVPAAIVLVFVAWASLRSGRGWQPLAVLGAVVAVSWLLLAGYNVAYFGHLSGFPESAPSFGRTSLSRIMALLFDRHQGLVVQLPTVMLGVIGARWVARAAPCATAAAALAVASVLVLNGTYVSNPLGGVTLAGRFEWTAMPVGVAFAAFALERWQAQDRAVLRGAVVVLGCWCYQSRSVVDHAHTGLYFTQLHGWDPAAYPGWWPGLDHLLPEYVFYPRVLGSPPIGAAVVILLALAVVWLPVLPWRAVWRREHRRTFLVGGGLVVAVVATLAVDPGTGLPPRPLTYTGADVGGVLVAAAKEVVGPVIPLQGVTSGTYLVTASYQLSGKASAELSVYCDRTATGGAHLSTRTALLSPSRRSVAVRIECSRPGSVAAGFRSPAGTHLTVGQVALAKTAE